MRTLKILLSIIFLCSVFGQETACGQDYRPDKYRGKAQTITMIRVASAAVIPDKWDKEVNWARTEKMVREAVSNGGADIVVTPEDILDGYVIEEANAISDRNEKERVTAKFEEVAEPMDGQYVKKACDLAGELDIFFIFGFLEKRDGRYYNSSILIDPDGDIIGRYSKTHFAEGYYIKPERYTPGDEYPVFDTPFGKVGIIICYDRQLPEPARIMAVKGAQVLFIPAYGSYTDENGWNTALLRTRAYENRCPVAYCNPFQSLLIDRNGNVRATGTAGEIVCYELDTSPSNYEGRFRNRRPDTYKEISAY